MEIADLPTRFSCKKKPAAETDALAQHTPRSATCMTNKASYVPNRKTKQYLNKASYVQKAWPDSIKGDSAATEFSECRFFQSLSSATKKSTRKPLSLKWSDGNHTKKRIHMSG